MPNPSLQPTFGRPRECRTRAAKDIKLRGHSFMKYHTVRRLQSDEWVTYRDLRLRSLSESPDAFGSTLARELQFSDALWKSRLYDASPDTDLPLLAEVGGAPAGLAWGKVFTDREPEAHLFQMWVAPEHRGCGVGAALLAQVVDWACRQKSLRLELSVTIGNGSALRLYERAGFKPCADPEPLREGSDILAQRMLLSL